MQLKICKRCKRPFLANKEFCPDCPAPYKWNQESAANLGCLIAMITPIFFIVFFWLVFFFGMFFAR